MYSVFLVFLFLKLIRRAADLSLFSEVFWVGAELLLVSEKLSRPTDGDGVEPGRW